MYVRSGEKASFAAVPPQKYRVRFMTGTRWIDDHFERSSRYSAFENPLSFDEQRSNDGMQYNEVSLTLHRVRSGNARTRSVPPFRLRRSRP